MESIYEEPLVPLRFCPQYKEKVWGGRKLRRRLGKDLPDASKVGEAWEVSDYPGSVSVVAGGPFDGVSLGELLRARREELLGAAACVRWPDRFPLLFKFVDASEALSIQVHPTREYIERHGIEDRSKSEAWYIVQADPGACVYHGWKPGTTRERAARAINEHRLAQLLQPVEVQAGDVVSLPAGTVHGIGAGVLLAEIQETSDQTFRLYDWDRPGLDGAPRPLHVREALETVSFEAPPAVSPPRRLEDFPYERFLLLSTQEFSMYRMGFTGLIYEPPADDGFVILAALSGEGALLWRGDTEEQTEFHAGDVLLVPASVGDFNLHSEEGAELLRLSL